MALSLGLASANHGSGHNIRYRSGRRGPLGVEHGRLIGIRGHTTNGGADDVRGGASNASCQSAPSQTFTHAVKFVSEREHHRPSPYRF